MHRFYFKNKHAQTCHRGIFALCFALHLQGRLLLFHLNNNIGVFCNINQCNTGNIEMIKK